MPSSTATVTESMSSTATATISQMRLVASRSCSSMVPSISWSSRRCCYFPLIWSLVDSYSQANCVPTFVNLHKSANLAACLAISPSQDPHLRTMPHRKRQAHVRLPLAYCCFAASLRVQSQHPFLACFVVLLRVEHRVELPFLPLR